MFYVTHDFSRGNRGRDNQINGFQTMVMNSQASTDQLISEFKKEINAGRDPNAVKGQVLSRCNIKESNLLDSDVTRLVREVENYYNQVNIKY